MNEHDAKHRNTMWQDALKKEMYNVGAAFKLLEMGQKAPARWTKVTGHLVWDVKMDFTHKARWVLDGHKTADPEGSTYAGVVSHESVQIALTYAALNGSMYVLLTSEMHTYKHDHRKRITSSVALNLDSRMLGRSH